jgi:hypothetical protein
MSEMIKILTLKNNVEANLIEQILKENGIPFVIKSFHDNVYDGLFQMQYGWGIIESYEENKEKIVSLYDEMTKETPETVSEESEKSEEIKNNKRLMPISVIILLSVILMSVLLSIAGKYCFHDGKSEVPEKTATTRSMK